MVVTAQLIIDTAFSMYRLSLVKTEPNNKQEYSIGRISVTSEQETITG